MGGWFILLAVLAVMLILGALVVVAVRPRGGGRDADTAAGYFVTDHRRRDDYGDARSDGNDDAEGEGD